MKGAVRSYLKPLGLTVGEMAKALGISRKHLSQIINARAAVTPVVALRLSKSLDTSVTLWLGMQQNYDLWRARQRADLSSVWVIAGSRDAIE